MKALYGLLFLLCFTAVSSVPTFTWSIQNPTFTCDVGAVNIPLGYINALYYWTIEIAECSYAPLTVDYRLIGPIDMDQGGHFVSTPPLECDVGTDMTAACIDNSGKIWWDVQGGGTFSVMANNYVGTPKGISVGSSSWVTAIGSDGTLYLYDSGGFRWNSVTTGASLMYASIGNDGVIAYLREDNTDPIGCQISGGALINCKSLGGAGASCNGLQVLNANNILCWNQWGLYWLTGGYNTNGPWVAVSNLPVAFDQTCFATTGPFTCLSRPNLGGENVSGNDYFTYRGTDGNWHGGKFPQQ